MDAFQRGLATALASGIFSVLVYAIQRYRKKKKTYLEPSEQEIIEKIAFNLAVYAGPLAASMLWFVVVVLSSVWLVIQMQGNLWPLTLLVLGYPMIHYFRYSARFQWSIGVAEGFKEASEVFSANPGKYIDAVVKTAEYKKAVRFRPIFVQKIFLRLAKTKAWSSETS